MSNNGTFVLIEFKYRDETLDLPLDRILLVQLLSQHRFDQQEARRPALYQVKRRDDL